MQNTMVREGPAGEINEIRSWGKKMKKGKEKRRKITLKKGEKPLKCIFLGYKLKKNSPPTNLFVGGK